MGHRPLSEENPVPDQLRALNARVNLHDGVASGRLCDLDPIRQEDWKGSEINCFPSSARWDMDLKGGSGALQHFWLEVLLEGLPVRLHHAGFDR